MPLGRLAGETDAPYRAEALARQRNEHFLRGERRVSWPGAWHLVQAHGNLPATFRFRDWECRRDDLQTPLLRFAKDKSSALYKTPRLKNPGIGVARAAFMVSRDLMAVKITVVIGYRPDFRERMIAHKWRSRRPFAVLTISRRVASLSHSATAFRSMPIPYHGAHLKDGFTLLQKLPPGSEIRRSPRRRYRPRDPAKCGAAAFRRCACNSMATMHSLGSVAMLPYCRCQRFSGRKRMLSFQAILVIDALQHRPKPSLAGTGLSADLHPKS